VWRASAAEITAILQAAAERESAIYRVARVAVGMLSDDARVSDYLERAGTSGELLFVLVGDRRDVIVNILKGHNAHYMRYFGRLTVEDLI
jgi:hypothetical protein